MRLPTLKSLLPLCISLAAFFLYGVFFFVFHHKIGEGTSIFVFIPVVLIAWLYGFRYGIAAALFADIFVLFLYQAFGEQGSFFAATNKRMPGLIAVIIIALIIGYMRSLRMLVDKELDENKKMQTQLEIKNKEIYDFTNVITHDLRKPLTTILLVLKLAKKEAFGALNPDGLEAIENGLEATHYMQEMLEDLLAYAKLDAKTQVFEREKISFCAIVNLVMTRLKIQFEAKKIRVYLPQTDITLQADKKQLARLLLNLLGNAINYIGTKNDKYIRIDWMQRDGEIVYKVEDNGIGIPAETQSSLFTKFKRGSNVSGISGTGLGLTIVKEIVTNHGGRIWCESKENFGTTFFFTLGA